jgi:hypothetical protein
MIDLDPPYRRQAGLILGISGDGPSSLNPASAIPQSDPASVTPKRKDGSRLGG